MKKLTLVLSVALTALLLQAHSCRKLDNPSDCGDIACTMMFAAVTVDVDDANGNPVILDEYYTIRVKNGQKITPESALATEGKYTVLDDGFMSTLKNSTEDFRFVGKKNGVEVVNEPYVIQGDCCHVDKKSGKATIVVP